MNIGTTIGTLVLLVVMTMPASLSLAAYSQESSVIAGGGGTSISTGYVLTGTIGQPVVGRTEGATHTNHSGFWNLRTGDTIAPGAPSFILTTPVRSRIIPFTVPISTLDATDIESGVTGYYLSGSPTPPTDAWSAGWNDPTPAGLQTATKGTQTIYAWARDAAGNISSGATANTETILQYLLSVSMAGSGDSSITSLPAGIGCSASTLEACSAHFDENAVVALTGNPDSISELINWTDAVISIDNPVNVAMNDNKNAIGTFATVTLPARIVYGKGFYTLTTLLPSITANSTIETRSDTYPAISAETLLFNNGYTVTLIGGRDANWVDTGNPTMVKGTLTIRSGKLNIKGGLKLLSSP